MTEPHPHRRDLHRFSRGEPIAVEIGEIERELADLWKQASAGPRPEGAVSRAALWNVVVAARGREALAATKHLVDEIAPALPTRTITICLDDGPRALGARAVEATIESNVVLQPGGARMVYSEEITLVGPAGAEAHFGTLVRGLGVPGVPTATFWLDTALPSSLLLGELVPISDRLVFDTTSCGRPQQLDELDRLVARTPSVPVADLGWLRLGGLRSVLAGLFDPPVGGEPLARATGLTVRHLEGCDVSALMVVAWFGVLLGLRPLRWAHTSDGGRRFFFARGEGADAALEAVLIPTAGPRGRSGILGVEIAAGADRYRLERAAVDQTRIETPIAPPRLVKLDFPTDAELAVAALGPRGRDPLFARCLRYAADLPRTTRR